jgi:SH3-like domain-containing protein
LNLTVKKEEIVRFSLVPRVHHAMKMFSRTTGFLALAAWLCIGSALAAGHPVVEVCSFRAYVNDPDPKGLNVRVGPSSTDSVIGVIREPDVDVRVTAARGSWLRISRAESVEGSILFQGEGWVYAPLTAVTSRYRVTLRTLPDAGSPAVAVMPAEEEGKILGCKGEWVKVRFRGKEGWMAPDSHCGSPVTTCP